MKKIDVKLLAGHEHKGINNGYEYIEHLKEKYLGKTSYEFNHIPDDEEREWLYQQVETGTFEIDFSDEDKKDLLKRLGEVEGFEAFLQKTLLLKNVSRLKALMLWFRCSTTLLKIVTKTPLNTS